jgi:hypothetical protein
MEEVVVEKATAPDHGEHGFRSKVSTVSGAR